MTLVCVGCPYIQPKTHHKLGFERFNYFKNQFPGSLKRHGSSLLMPLRKKGYENARNEAAKVRKKENNGKIINDGRKNIVQGLLG